MAGPEIRRFKTSDGRVFSDRPKAELHEARLAVARAAAGLGLDGVAVIKAIELNRNKVAGLLRAIAKLEASPDDTPPRGVHSDDVSTDRIVPTGSKAETQMALIPKRRSPPPRLPSDDEVPESQSSTNAQAATEEAEAVVDGPADGLRRRESEAESSRSARRATAGTRRRYGSVRRRRS